MFERRGQNGKYLNLITIRFILEFRTEHLIPLLSYTSEVINLNRSNQNFKIQILILISYCSILC